MEETPLNPKDMKIPNGLRYHVMDIWVDELGKVSGDKWEKEPGSEMLETLVKPIETMKKEGALKVLRVAAQECLDEEELKSWRGIVDEKADESMGSDEDSEQEWGGFAD